MRTTGVSVLMAAFFRIQIIARPPGAGLCIGDGGRDGELDLRASAFLAPHLEFALDRRSPLAHAPHTPMPASLGMLESFGIEPGPIIPNTQGECLVAKGDLRFDGTRVGVLNGISKCLLGNP